MTDEMCRGRDTAKVGHSLRRILRAGRHRREYERLLQDGF